MNCDEQEFMNKLLNQGIRLKKCKKFMEKIINE